VLPVDCTGWRGRAEIRVKIGVIQATVLMSCSGGVKKYDLRLISGLLGEVSKKSVRRMAIQRAAEGLIQDKTSRDPEELSNIYARAGKLDSAFHTAENYRSDDKEFIGSVPLCQQKPEAALLQHMKDP
jgi:hypothetical protein